MCVFALGMLFHIGPLEQFSKTRETRVEAAVTRDALPSWACFAGSFKIPLSLCHLGSSVSLIVSHPLLRSASGTSPRVTWLHLQRISRIRSPGSLCTWLSLQRLLGSSFLTANCCLSQGLDGARLNVPQGLWGEVLDSLRSQHELERSTLSLLTTNHPCDLMSPDKRSYRKGTRLASGKMAGPSVSWWPLPLTYMVVWGTFVLSALSCFLLQQHGLEFSHTEFSPGLTNGRDLTPGTAHQLVLDEQGSMIWISPNIA